MVFVLINYLDRPHWPIEPILRIFDGRYSNTAVYPFILFVVLKLKKRPGVSIPLFIICSIFYYIADHRLYALFEPGSGVMYIKLTKYFLFTFVLVYGYSKSRYRLAGAFILSSVTGVAMYSLVTSFLLLSFFSSPTGSSALQISGAILLKSGYQFPLKKLLTNALDHADTADTKSIIQFIDKHGIDTGYTAEEWESIILKNDIRNIEFIFRHLNRKNIQINFEVLKTYAKSQLKNSPPKAAELTQFTKYFGQYYPDNKKDFFEFYKSGNEPVKIIILRSLAYTEDYYAVMFLIDRITSVEPMSAESAYASLKKISVSDPAAELKKSRHDYEVVQHFRDFASKMKR
jgi:hypothetical protein